MCPRAHVLTMDLDGLVSSFAGGIDLGNRALD
jgi:hypothetical protein